MMPTVPIALAAQIVAIANQIAAAPTAPTPSPTPTPIPGLLNDIVSGQSFTANNGDVWSIFFDGKYDLVMRNGERAAGFIGSRVVETTDLKIIAQSHTTSWFLWLGSGWTQTKSPV